MTTANQNSEISFAVVTGASSGIGLHLAKEFIQNGCKHLLIVAEDAGIHQTATQLQNSGATVQALQIDLAKYEGVDELQKAIKATGKPLDAIAVNAGVGVGGPFTETDLKEEMNMMHLNVISSVHLTKHVLKDMVARNKGRILITASIASTMPAPFEAVYGATKAFLLSFSDALRGELKETGVTVTALMPGATNTNFFHRAGMDDTKVGTEGKFDNEPEDVARQGYKAMMAGDAHIISAGLKTKLMGMMGEILPESVKAQIHRSMAEPGSAKK